MGLRESKHGLVLMECEWTREEQIPSLRYGMEMQKAGEVYPFPPFAMKPRRMGHPSACAVNVAGIAGLHWR